MNAHVDPAQVTAKSTPASEEGDAPVTLWLADMNDMNEHLGGIASAIRYDHRDFIDRVMMNNVGNSAFKLMCAINTRTFSFTKIAETIPQEQFTSGLRRSNRDNTLVLDKYGKPLFEGTGLSRNSVKSGISELKSKGVLTSFTVMVPKTGPVTAYMPMSWRSLFICASPFLGRSIKYLDKLCNDHPTIAEEIFGPPMHELEARYAEQFPEGLKVSSMIRSKYGDDLSRVSDREIMKAIRKDDEEGAMVGVKN